MQILSNPMSALYVRESRVEEHDVDIRFYTGSGNMVILCMRNASGLNYRNSSVRSLWTWHWGRPRSTERIS